LLVRTAPFLVGEAALPKENASLLEGNESLRKVNASLREMNGSLREDNDRLLNGEVSLPDGNASFALGSATVAFFHARFVEGRAALGLGEAAGARVRETVRTAATSLAERSGAPHKDE
jgi:hypothetical protein